MKRLWMPLAWVVAAGIAVPAVAVEPDVKIIEALRPFDGMVGIWKGTGSSPTSSGWKETLDCEWGYREKDGRVSLDLYIENGEMVDDALITYHPETDRYRFVARTPKGEILRFEGGLSGDYSLTFDRADEKANDDLDRVEVKLVREGQKMIYTFKRKVGTQYFETHSNIELFRETPPLTEFANNPRCVVTGGFGRIPVEYKGETYYVACQSTRIEFLTRPDLYISRQKEEM